jgi:prepilin-type N-terminal cleavage/methylation domain-containing protein
MRPSGHKGFTIIELAMVLVIIGMIVGFGASIVGPLTMRAKRNETKEITQAAVDSIIGYAAINNLVPDLTAPTNPDHFSTVVRTQNDSSGRPLQYVFDNALATPATPICSRTTTNITVRICNDAACGTFSQINNVAFLVVSPGENANNQTAGSQAVAAATVINTYQTGIQADPFAGDFTRATDDYDDIIKWITLAELQTKLACSRCSAYEIWNNGATANFQVNGIGCSQTVAGSLISSIGPGGSVLGYDAPCSTPTGSSITAAAAAISDINRNCAVNFDGTDR